MSTLETITIEVSFLKWLLDEAGIKDVKKIGENHWAGTKDFMFTHAVIVGRIGDIYGFDNRWCYKNHRDAKRALDGWSGHGEPDGWHRHPASGRRVSESADEQDEDGKPVGAVGITYIRF